MLQGQSLKQLYESLGPVGCVAKLTECLEQRLVRPEDFSIRDLAESFCGHDWVKRLNPQAQGRYGEVPLREAGEGVDVSAFSNITGQIFFNKIMEGWKLAVKVGEALTENFPTKLDGERMPWLSHPKGFGEEIHAGAQYPETNFAERYIDTPRTTKQGQIMSITKEMIFFDLTGQVLRAAGEIGMMLGYNKEKRILRTIMGLTTGNQYKLNGTSYNVFSTSAQDTGGGNYINQASGTPLVDWTSVQNAYVLWSKILDPDSALPIIVEPKAFLVMPYKFLTARRIVSATEVRSTYPGYTSTSNPAPPGNTQMISGNPLPDNLEVHQSSIAFQLLLSDAGLTGTQAQDYWMVGDFKRAFAYMENWPLQVVQAPAQSIKEFEQDIVLRYKASERGSCAVLDPRYVIQFYNT